MANSTTGSASRKPHPDFPLTPRGDGRWCKKVKGEMKYFTGTAQEALDEWNRVKDDLLAGNAPRPKGNSIGLADLVNAFLHAKLQRTQGKTSEVSPRTWKRYEATGKAMVAFFGRTTPVDSIGPQDFAGFRASMAKRLGLVAMANEIQMVRSIFIWGLKAEKLASPARFGGDFDKPSRTMIEHARNVKGPRDFSAEQVRQLLKHSGLNMKAMILLGLNGGLGNTDLGELPSKAFDLDAGWLDYPRPKTGRKRRIPLWPETVAAVRDALAKRKSPNDPADERLLFIGGRGESYAGDHKGYRVAAEFSRAAVAAGVEGRSFYDLRRTFQTVAENSLDLVAVKSIMGHAPASGDMSSVYRQRIDDARLRAVGDVVRAWLYPPATDEAKSDKGGSSKAKSKRDPGPKPKRAAKVEPRKGRATAEAAAELFQLRIVG